MSANQYKLKVKVNNNDDTRLWRNASPNDFEGLCSFISTTWNNTNFIAQYEDDEGDLITIASIQDLKDAFDFAQEENKKSLKIFVQNTQKRSPQPQPQPSQPQIQSEPESEPQLEEKQEAKEFNSVHDMAFDFLSNKEIILLLPEMFGLLIDKLIKKGNNLSVDEIILLINTEIINNGQFNIIISHPLYVTYGVLAIPFIASKIAGQQSLYPHFNLQTIKTWITQVLQMFTQAIKQMNNGKCSFKDIVIDIQYPPVTDDGKVIHFGVECDLCGEYPIIGDRYKCSICEDWDCCPKCEPKHDHPLIKFKKSSKNHQNAAFKGLNEIVQRFSGINIENKNNKVEKKEDINDNDIDIYDEMVVDCICGTKMDCIIAKNAYNKCNTVYCDECSCQLFNEMVYHCPKNKDPVHHQNGYDLCGKCSHKKVENDKLKEEQEEEQQQEQQQEEVEEPKDEQEPEEEPKEEEEEEFEYLAQLTQIKQIMGYGSESNEMVKQILIKHKGDIAKVVPLLLNLQ
eukprot:518115_1